MSDLVAHPRPCGCARGHCEVATVAQCQQIQASALALAGQTLGVGALGIDVVPMAQPRRDAVRSGREALTC